MKLEIPITVEFDDVLEMVDEIKSLQTYKLSEDDDMVLVNREDVADILARHVKAKNKQLDGLLSAQPKRGRWILDRSGAYCCSECMEPCAGYVMMRPRDKFCKMCGAKMEGEYDG